MSDWPPLVIPPNTIYPLHDDMLGPELRVNGAGLASAVWPNASTAIFVPFSIHYPTVAKKLWIYNGTVVSGNFDIGIYSQGLVRLGSTGSTAQAGTSVPQIIDVTDIPLSPGTYYLATVIDNITATTMRSTPTATTRGRAFGLFAQNSALPLPATATPITIVHSYLTFSGIVLGRML